MSLDFVADESGPRIPPLEAVRLWRARQAVEKSAGSWEAENARCASDVLYWWDRWLWTYDPRLIGERDADGNYLTGYVRFRLWPKQREVVLQLLGHIAAREEGLLEKSRDTGATFLCCGVALWLWRYRAGFKATFGSRKLEYVDKSENPDAIFPKIRIMLDRMPPEMLPRGFVRHRHDKYLRLVNPEISSIITGEGGDEMGRGGRSTVFFLDEAALVEHADVVERAIGGNTDCVIWVSTAYGMGNLFARKRHSILQSRQIMRIHWRDDPRKTEEWARAKRESYSDPTAFASEYDIDYTASVEGICIPAAWVESAKRLAALAPIKPDPAGVIGLDVGAGKNKSVAVQRFGPVVLKPRSRGEPDTTDTALWALDIAKEVGAKRLSFDAPGVGAGVSSTLMHNPQEGLIVSAINTGMPPGDRLWPDGRTSDQIFGNLKAEIWWMARTAFQRTHEYVLFLEGRRGGKPHALSDLIAMPSGDRESDQLCLEVTLVKWGKNEKGKIVIEKKDALLRRGIQSPDYADALMLTWADGGYDVSGAWMGMAPQLNR